MLRAMMVALALALSGSAASAQVSPLSDSNQIRGNRPLGEVEALVFDLRRETHASGKTPEVVDQVVTLGPTFSLVVERDHRSLEDHALCRSLAWTDRGATFENGSCYAAVAFRLVELQNRQLLAGGMNAIKPGLM